MMLYKRLFPAVCAGALALTLAFALSACKKAAAPEEEMTAPDPAAVDTEAASKAAADLHTAVEEINALAEANDTGVLVRVMNATGLATALQEKSGRTIRLQGKDVSGEIEIPEGDHSARGFIFDAPDASILAASPMGTVTLTDLNDDGAVFNGHVGTLYVAGGGLNVTLNGGADKVYVTGANANVQFAGGEFPLVYCDNSTCVLRNQTGAPVRLVLPNGNTVTIPAGRAYSMSSGLLD